MKEKDRQSLYAVAHMLGIVHANANELPEDVTKDHDWSKFLLANEMYKDFRGPAWVPFHLWQASQLSLPHSPISRTLITAPGAEALWASIEKFYPRPDSISIQLPLDIHLAKEEWAGMSKRTPSEHKEHFARLAAHALSLAIEVERIEETEKRGSGDEFDFLRLYSDEEKTIVFQNVQRFNLTMRKDGAADVDAMKLGYRRGMTYGKVSQEDWEDYIAPGNPAEPESATNLSPANYDSQSLFRLLIGDEDGWPGIIPKVPPMLRRLSNFMKARAERPIVSRPKFANAERNHVARHLCRFFSNSFGMVSPSIVASVVSMFYEQGITDNEVSQMIKSLGSLPPVPLRAV